VKSCECLNRRQLRRAHRKGQCCDAQVQTCSCEAPISSCGCSSEAAPAAPAPAAGEEAAPEAPTT
jgi:hypothetical protein